MEHDCFECDRCGRQEPGRLACFDMVREACLRKERDELIKERDEFKRSRDDLALKLFKRTGERDEAKEVCEYYEGRCDTLVDRFNKFKKEHDELKKERDKPKADYSQLIRNHCLTLGEKTKLKKERDDFLSGLFRCTAERDRLKRERDRLKSAHNKLEEQSNKDCEYLNTKCGRLEKERDELKKERDRFQCAYSQVNGLYFSLNEKKELKAENDKLKKERDRFKTACDRFKENDAFNRKIHDNTKRKLEHSRERNKCYKEENSELKTRVRGLEKENDKLKYKIPASKRTQGPVKACSNCRRRSFCFNHRECLGTYKGPFFLYSYWEKEKNANQD